MMRQLLYSELIKFKFELLQKVQFHWVNIIITVVLLLILLGGKHFDLSYRKAIFESNNIILWGVDVPDLFYPCLLCSMLLFSVVPRKLWLRDNNKVSFNRSL